jgi:hypothetical protein
MTDSDDTRARLVGINHVALEVGDVDEALEFYGAIFDFELRGRSASSAFLDMGDQFLALGESESVHGNDGHRHLGLVVDDPSGVEHRLNELGVERLPTSGLDVRDPWAIASRSSATRRSSTRRRTTSSAGWTSRDSGSPTPPSRSSPRRGWDPTD